MRRRRRRRLPRANVVDVLVVCTLLLIMNCHLVVHTHTQLISEFAKESSPTPPKTVVHMMQARGLDIQSNGSLGRIVPSVVVLITA